MAKKEKYLFVITDKGHIEEAVNEVAGRGYHYCDIYKDNTLYVVVMEADGDDALVIKAEKPKRPGTIDLTVEGTASSES